MLKIFTIFALISLGLNWTNTLVSHEQNTNSLPPGCVKILDDLYADKAEISNINYREFQHWNKRIFGITSKEYQATKLDTNVWLALKGMSKLSKQYHIDERYYHYPVVGISLDQAWTYTRWRTDRVMEATLIEQNLMRFNTDQHAENYFTFEKFIKGTIDYVKGDIEFVNDSNEIDLVEYQIPNAKEWELISGVKDEHISDLDLGLRNKEIIEKYGYLYNTIELNNSRKHKHILKRLTGRKKITTLPTTMSAQNTFGMYGVVGNVSELIDEEGRSMGANWKSSASKFSKEKVNIFEEPNSWTGFRNICYVKKIEININNGGK